MVHIVHLTIRKKLNLFAGQVINRKTEFLIRADHETELRVFRVNPESRIVGGVTTRIDSICLDSRGDFLNTRCASRPGWPTTMG